MTHQTKSVRANAEALNHTIPTFDEVYAHPYVQASLKFLVENNSIEYPMLAPYADDIRQEMLIYLARRLHSYQPQKSSIKTFCRRVLECGLRNARRYYFTDTQKALSQAIPLDELSEGEQSDSLAGISNACRSNVEYRSVSPFDVAERREAILVALKELSKKDQAVAKAIMDGLSQREIIRRHLCSCSRDLLHRVLPRIRAAMERNFF